MNCPKCDTPKMIVIASRDTPESMYRHRLCEACKQRVTTVELYSPDNLDAALPQVKRNKKENT